MAATKAITEAITEATTISTNRLRLYLGLIGISLPLILIVANSLACEGLGLQASLSHYYHTGVGVYFVGAICAIGVFLFAYQGYRPRPSEWLKDSLITNAAGLFAIGVALFPTRFDDADKGQAAAMGQMSCGLDRQPLLWPLINDYDFIGRIHLISAGLMFICLAIMCFQFTRHEPSGQMTQQKRTRNRVYYLCGIGIIVSIAWIFASMFLDDFPIGFNYDVLLFESVAVVLFGLAWLTKSEVILADV